jgi:hypothetical protein
MRLRQAQSTGLAETVGGRQEARKFEPAADDYVEDVPRDFCFASATRRR